MCTLQVDWYTKRASLATVYTSTEVYMMQDNSHEFDNTWNFLDRQLACGEQLGQCLGMVRRIHHCIVVFARVHTDPGKFWNQA